MRTIIYHPDGRKEIIDNRTLESGKADLIALHKEVCGMKILESFPLYKQMNASLGLYSEKEVIDIKNGIQALRDECNAKEAAINACKTLEELDNL